MSNSHSNNRNIITQTSDKGNSVVLVDKDKYLEGMCKILNNNAKFQMLQFDHGKELNYILNLEKSVIDVLKDLKNKRLQRLITTTLALRLSFWDIIWYGQGA